MVEDLKILSNLIQARAKYFLAYFNGHANTIMELGQHLIQEGYDERSDGFWVVELLEEMKDDSPEFYSNKFRSVLGYSGEEDFPPIYSSWRNRINKESLEKATKMLVEHIQNPENKFWVNCTYSKKDGSKVNLLCYGSIVNRSHVDQYGGNYIMIGTHELLE